MRSNAHLAIVPTASPTTESVKVDQRSYLTPSEVDTLITAAGRVGRHRHRDATLILIGYRHGYRISELVSLRWDQVNLREGLLHVTRRKHGSPSTHPLRGVELRALRRLAREYPSSSYVFLTERGGPLTTNAAYRVIVRAGALAGLPVRTHPHVLRHSAGYKLASDGQDLRAIAGYLGHRNVQNTMRYCELSPNRFRDFWLD